MSDRIDELVQQVMDVFAHSQNPETDEWELSGDLDQYPSYVALTELATIAREATELVEKRGLDTKDAQRALFKANELNKTLLKEHYIGDKIVQAMRHAGPRPDIHYAVVQWVSHNWPSLWTALAEYSKVHDKTSIERNKE